MITDIQVQHELLKTALSATDGYLNVEAHAIQAKTATAPMLKEFTTFYNIAYQALESLGVLDQHQTYMRTHLETMMSLNQDEDATLADDPYTSNPSGGGGMDESVTSSFFRNRSKIQKVSKRPDRPPPKTDLRVGDKVVADTSKEDYPGGHKQRTGTVTRVGQKGVHIKTDDSKEPEWHPYEIVKKHKNSAASTGNLFSEEVDEAFKAPTPTAAERMYANQQKLRKEKGLPDPSQYKKMGDQKQKEINGMKSESRVISFNQYINEEVEDTLSEKEIDEMVDHLDWEDIVDLYDENELVDVEEDPMYEELDEALSAQARLKKRQSFQRSKGKRNLSRGMKLRRASDPSTLQKRARLAARRSIMNKLLKGRNKSQLSNSEKDRIEKQLSSMKNVMSTIQQKFIPKIRSIEQKRLANYRGKKK
jgi:hypothetical protein